MAEPVYDVETLRKHIRLMQRDIEANEAAIAELRRRIAEYEQCIAVADAVKRRDGG